MISGALKNMNQYLKSVISDKSKLMLEETTIASLHSISCLFLVYIAVT